MKKIVKIEVSIESDFGVGMTANYNLSDMLFTDFNNIMRPDGLLANYKAAMRRLGDFSSITISLIVKEDYMYSYDNRSCVKSVRYVNRHGNIEASNFDGHRYNNFQPAERKSIERRIVEYVDCANEKFIECLKQNQNQ